jgi:Carbohydrate binding domain
VWTGVVLAVLFALTAVAWAASRGGPEPANEPAAEAPAVAASGTTSQAPAGTGAAPATSQGSGDGPKNLLANASFESGMQGWRPIGGSRVARSTESTEGGWSLRILADPEGDGPVGITVPAATLTKAGGRYHTNAWAKPSAPGATVTIGLREYKDGKPVPGSNTLGWTVEKTGWRRFGAIHVATQPGSSLALEITARDLPPDGYLDVDDVVLHLLGGN